MTMNNYAFYNVIAAVSNRDNYALNADNNFKYIHPAYDVVLISRQ